MRKILIAGSGYVGAATAALLERDGHQVFRVRRNVTPGYLSVDLVDGSLDALPRGLDAVVFAAAPGGGSVAAYEAVYVRALGRVLEYLDRTGASQTRLVLTSSTSVYGQTNGEWVDEDSPAEPESATAALIRRGERLLRPGDAALRLGGIYGPGRESFLNSIRSGAIRVNPLQSAFTNRIHRDDAAGILRHLLGIDKLYTVYNGVDCEPAPRAVVAGWIAARLGVAVAEAAEEEASALRGNKRVSNARLLAAGYRFVYPTYKEGYGAHCEGQALT